MAEYAEQLARGDTGHWRASLRHAVGWIGARHPTIDFSRRVPVPQLMLQTTALVVYGLAHGRGADPTTVGAGDVLRWVGARQLPMPPEPGGPGEFGDIGTLLDQTRLWRLEVDDAVERQQRDLAGLLQAAGHPVPLPGLRSLERYSPDPVIATWLALVDTAPPDDDNSMMDLFPGPPLSLGLSAISDIE